MSSRIGKLPIQIPSGVTVTVQDGTVEVIGPKGKVKKTFSKEVKITVDGVTVTVEPASSNRLAFAMHGTARSIINAMVQGVISPFVKNLEIQGVGFRAQLKGKVLNLNLGYSHDINYGLPPDVILGVTDNGTKLEVVGPDKQQVGQVAARIKQFYPVEPYKGKGVRIQGEPIYRKVGKKSAK